MDLLSKEINTLFLCEKLTQADYSDLFYNHLTGLLKYKLLGGKNDVDEFKLNQKNYLGLEQFIFENTKIVETNEPQKINWDLIDEAKDFLKIKIQKSLKSEGTSNHLKPIISFTVDSYENWLLYRQLHPSSSLNPWIPTNEILLQKGYLFLASDKRDLIEEYEKKVYSKVDNETQGNIGVIAKSGKENKFSGFLVDNRNNLQGLVYDFLRREANGFANAKGTQRIAKFLKEQNKKNYSENEIRNRITIPLKRAGLIGSSTSGFYFIGKPEDLSYTYKYHKTKIESIQRTLEMYSRKAEKWGMSLQ